MRLSLFAVAALCVSSVAAHATSITYTERATATGSLDGVAFTNQLLTLTATSDSAAVMSSGGTYFTPQLTISGLVAGIGSFTIAGGQVFGNQTYTVDGFTDGKLGDILDIVNPVFSAYDLKSAIGPVSGSTESSLQNYPTATGNFNLSSVGSTGSFQAAVTTSAPVAVTPEPSSITLLGTGLFGVFGMMKRRFA